jgi:hypothetical protein
MLRQPIFERLDPFRKARDRLGHPMEQQDNCLFALSVGRSHFCFGGKV